MKQKCLGRTGLMVTENSFGALPIQRISDSEAAGLLRYAYDRGVNFFDTARAYSDSEEKIGEALHDVRHWAWPMCGKTSSWPPRPWPAPGRPPWPTWRPPLPT